MTDQFQNLTCCQGKKNKDAKKMKLFSFSKDNIEGFISFNESNIET